MAVHDPRYADALKALKSLEAAGYATRLAGGCVRDRLIGRRPADYDVATAATPDQVMLHFRAEKLSTVPTGLDHGTVTLLMPAGPVEITTLRRDEKTDGRHAQVAFGLSFEEDAQRRDFTINALFEDADGRIDDLVGGQADLKQGILRFVGLPVARIREDYLRILRLFRFWAQLGFQPEPSALAAAATEREGLKKISQERVTQEWWKLAAGVSAPAALQAMLDTGVLNLILPELTPASLPPVETIKAWQTGKPEGLALLAGLGLQQGLGQEQLTSLGERLRLASRDSKRLAFFASAKQKVLAGWSQTADGLLFLDDCAAVSGEGSYAELLAPVLRTEQSLQTNLLQLEKADREFGHRRNAELPLNGKDVLRYSGMKPGPEIGELLLRLRRGYYNGEWATQAEGIAWMAGGRPHKP